MRLFLWLAALLVALFAAAPWQVTADAPAWDPRLGELLVSYHPAQECAAGCWRLVEARLLDEEESAGLHHVFVRLLDEEGRQIAGGTWAVRWPDGSDTLLSKPAPDWADYPLWACHRPREGEPGPYAVFVGAAQAESDVVAGLGLPYCLHVSYRLTFQRDRGGATPTPAPCVACAERYWLPLVMR